MKKWSICIILAAFSAVSNAATINATRVGALWTTTPVAETAFQALAQFRGQFTPVNALVVAANVILINKIGDGINALRVQMASPLPSSHSPNGWADSETPPNSSTPIQQATSWTAGGVSGATPSEACANSGSSGYSTGVISGQISGGYTCEWRRNSDQYVIGSTTVYPENSTTTCQAGYTLSGNTCTLSAPSSVMWPSDGVPTLKPVNGVLTPAARDPDNEGLSSGTVERTGTDDYGNPVHEKISTNSQNGIDYRRDTESVNQSTGEPVVQRDQYSTDANGNVMSSTSTVYNNSSVSNVTTNQSTIDTSTLAKESTLSSINDKLTTQSFGLPDQGAPRTIADSNLAVTSAFFSHLPAVTMSDDVPECPTFSAVIPFLNFTMTIDQFCTLDQYIRPFLNIAAFATYTLMGIIIIMGA